MKIGYTIFEKEYPGIESLGLDGLDLGATRKDQRNQFEVKIEKNFRAFSLFFSYAHIKNASNDPLFDWKGCLISGGLQWNIAVGKDP
jgi:hypothetical protein